MFQNFKTKVALGVASVPALMASAHAALPSGVESAINSVGSDLETAATAILTAMIGFWALRKLGSKMGWW